MLLGLFWNYLLLGSIASGASAIANSPNIAGLTSLNLSFNQIEDAVKEEINPKCVVVL